MGLQAIPAQAVPGAFTPGDPGGTPVTFPGAVLPIMVELLLNGTWTDITSYVYQRAPIAITSGRPDEASTVNPAQATLTVNNRGGDFTPLNTAGQFYPFLTRNVQIRISVQGALSATGTSYTGYRFWGEVSAWPPRWDPSGSDVWAEVTASGILRRLNQSSKIGSALYRYYTRLTDATAPIAYWPCEDGSNAAVITSPTAGVDDGTFTGSPQFATDTSFAGSDAIPGLNSSVWTLVTGVTGNPPASSSVTQSTPGTYSWTAPASVSAITNQCWAGGGGGGNGNPGGAGTTFGGGGAGGGEYASEGSLAVTPGKAYKYGVGPGGGSNSDGGDSYFIGDSVTVRAHGGKHGRSNGVGGAGGTGSTNTTHHDGGAGSTMPGAVGSGEAGGGGGGSGGTSAAGNSVPANTGGPGSGAAAVTGGGPGGDGGGSGSSLSPGKRPASGPGGGGGGGGSNTATGKPGANGDAGQVAFSWTASAGSSVQNNVLRFLLHVPTGGTHDGGILARMSTFGTVDHVDVVYHTGGNLELIGYNASSVVIFDSGSHAFTANGTPMLVSAQLAASGANINWTLTAIKPGATTAVATFTGSIVGSVGDVSEVDVNVGGAITDATAIGHVSVQHYAGDLATVASAVNGFAGELAVDRFARLCAEEGVPATVTMSETVDHWDFETGTESWSGSGQNCTVSPSSAWSSSRANSLAVTSSAAGAFKAYTPQMFCSSSSWLAVSADVYAPAGLSDAFIGIQFYNSGTGLPIGTEQDSTPVAIPAGSSVKLHVSAVVGAIVPGFTPGHNFAIFAGDSNAGNTAGTQLLIDNVNISPACGPQADDKLITVLQAVEDLDRGLLREPRGSFGLNYRTRMSLQNQTAAATFSYSLAELAGDLQPTYDDQMTRNDVIVSRGGGSSAEAIAATGAMSVQDPPNGVGRYTYSVSVSAYRDEQLATLAAWLLTLGTVDEDRYPSVTLNLARAEVAALLAAIAALDAGDYFAITNPPAWLPTGVIKQLAYGFTETLGPFGVWQIAMNAVPESPYEQASPPTW